MTSRDTSPEGRHTGQAEGCAAPLVAGVFHTGITVGEMERSLRFYRDALGFVVESDDVIDHPYVFTLTAVPAQEIRVVFLRVPAGGDGHEPVDNTSGARDGRIELLEYRGIERRPIDVRPCDPGHGHICLLVSDVDQAYRRLAASGYGGRSEGPVEYEAGPRKGAKAVYTVDPDGYNVELFQPPADLGGAF